VSNQAPGDTPDFALIERIFEFRMHEQGLSPRPLAPGIDGSYRHWAFCQFALMHPPGPDHDMEAELLRHHKERFGDPEPEVPR
jgi:hypothetical protein